MEFPYVKVLDFPKHQKRARLLPWVKVGIFNPQNPENLIYPLGLVDSGSDFTMMDREIGESLGNVFPSSYPQQTAIFGTYGFFMHLKVTFVFPREIIIERLSP